MEENEFKKSEDTEIRRVEGANDTTAELESVFIKKDIAEKGKAKSARIVGEFYDWIEVFIIAICTVALIFTFVARLVTVEGESMTYTLAENDRLVVSNVFYTPKTGDIVVIHVPNEDKPLIKRVIATEGQTLDIDFDTWTVTVDGKVLSEPYVRRDDPTSPMRRGSASDEDFPLTVPEGYIFVMGDNRQNSLDSRFSSIGFVDRRDIVGRVLVRLFPITRFGVVRPVSE